MAEPWYNRLRACHTAYPVSFSNKRSVYILFHFVNFEHP